ncbi:MAG: toll/interleukin-1 receptor domain-containing protein [Caldimonas sp.]
MRDGIFISYAHADRAWLAQLQQVLQALPGAVRISAWDDTRLAPGSRWQGEIKEALDTAAAAVLLLSPAFFASEFIAAHELPEVLAAAAKGEVVILPLVLAPCAHAAVTSTWQSVHDPAAPLEALDEAGRDRAWQRLLASLNDVAAVIGDEAHIGAEVIRLGNDIAASADVAHVLDKMARAKVDPAFDSDEAKRENTMVFLEGQRCQAMATRLMEEMKRPDLSPFRSKAVVRILEQVSRDEELALRRATELTQEFANQAMAMLQQAKGPAAGGQ